MINYSVSIGLPTAMVLIAFDEWRKTGYTDSDESNTPFTNRSLTRNFVGACDKLIKHGYLTHTREKDKKGREINTWRVTRKGELMAELIRLELEGVAKMVKNLKAVTKKELEKGA